jgi:D-alanyl-D-alanine carboxypeptidase (penicillin-binding protein 5/6)
VVGAQRFQGFVSRHERVSREGYRHCIDTKRRGACDDRAPDLCEQGTEVLFGDIFREDDMNQLLESIREGGIRVPLIIRWPGLMAGERIRVDELLYALLLQSANDAADALALATAPSFPAFAAMMNAQAATLGLTDSHFVRPDGLDAPGERSSARDVTKLALVAMKIPVVRDTVRRAAGTLADGSRLHTWNDLLGVVPGVFGVKTGHTDGAGWSQVAAVHGDGTTIYATILGSPTRTQRNEDLQALLAYGLNQYRRVDAVARGRGYASVQLPYGRSPVRLVAAAPLQAVVRIGVPLTQRVVAPVASSLPVRRGQVLGRVQVYAGRQLLGTRDLVAARSVQKPGAVARVAWYAGRTVHHVVGLVTP